MIGAKRYPIAGGTLHCWHRKTGAAQASLLFIHGLGESSLCFLDALAHPFLQKYDVVIPDLLGFGRSSRAEGADYSFKAQIARLAALLDILKIDQVHVIGHSMGGDLGTLFCKKYSNRAISLVNVEGDLTTADRFITDEALRAEREGRFEDWLRNDFAEITVTEWAQKWPSCVRYLPSLQLCSPAAFLASAKQIFKYNSSIGDDHETGKIGLKYRCLELPKVFCSGAGLSASSKRFLTRNNLAHRHFPEAFHWVMLDSPRRFYRWLAKFVVANAV